ncbi:serine/threonine-protein kinase [Daejeonella sp. JGW-45]|uniref:serine/threonine protein kinase n=1 Tax=Daejeonella sp. JGW-45 TaxID=3034148 RepID=UPI0023EBBC1C|nr:serine/threonine-protein kinase [Daejeonella sp. JGW-45]
MGKVFTIAEGLENMGAIRTGGQGSVYKGRRIGEIISAVKLLPTPIHQEDKNDKNYRDFLNEVEKLKKVNEVPNPNVVKILNSGLTESGSFPYIEMEFIEGPDLEELLESPSDPVFTIHELIKVVTQLSNALAHCHKLGIKHGDIKSNNVKLNIYTGNYVLLDFGLAIMSDEQRRTSLRHAGAIEFMAPEQNEGQMLFQSDVYSFGVILYELLAGTVPFPLNDKGETARNKVMISHMEEPVPDVMALRRQHLPKSWSAEKRESEMRVPTWLLETLDRCLEKKASNRFKDGVELHASIIHNYTADIGSSEAMAGRLSKLEKENEVLKSKIATVNEANTVFDPLPPVPDPDRVSLSKPLFYLLVLMLLASTGLAAYTFYTREQPVIETNTFSPVDTMQTDSADLSNEPQRRVKDNHDKEIRALIDSVQKSDEQIDTVLPSEDESVIEELPAETPESEPMAGNSDEPPVRAPKYTLAANRAYFYTDPNESSRMHNFLARSNNPELTALDDRNGFIYVVFFTKNGQVIKGWLRKRDLRRM